MGQPEAILLLRMAAAFDRLADEAMSLRLDEVIGAVSPPQSGYSPGG